MIRDGDLEDPKDRDSFKYVEVITVYEKDSEG